MFLLILSSCETNYSTSELKSNFTNDQISDLTKIVEFFKENVCTDKNADLNSCYKQANHDSLQANGTGIWTKIDFKDQKSSTNKSRNRLLMKFGCIVNRLIIRVR